MRKIDKYTPSEIEPKWQKRWERAKIYRAIDFDKRPKKYVLIEFPYPSGERLHVGHGRSFTALDALARKFRMMGFNVLYPFGWDAFGLPTENYALRTGINPEVATAKNIANAKLQAKSWGLSFDWEREVNTTNPKYYKWTQWIFLKLLEKGLAYQAEVPVNWCPSCKTNLADEEVLADGTHERCGQPTERRLQKQWLLKITAYAEKLLDDLKTVDYLPRIRIQQENWIGRTEGITIDYPVVGSQKVVSCYSTRPDTNFGATFVVIAPEHPLAEELTTLENKEKVSEYIAISRKKSELERTSLEKEKTGVFTGSYCLNRLTGKKMPVWVSDFVVLTAGTGIVVGVPAHDERDWQFAQKYGLEIMPVVKPSDSEGEWDFQKRAFTEINDAVIFNSDFLNGLPAQEAIKKIIDYLVKKGWGEKAVNFHLRDWVFSRQHYWGEPIPVVYCVKCAKTSGISNFKFQISNLDGVEYAVVPIPEDQLPVELPYLEKYQPSGTGESPLATVEEWVNTKCPVCGGPAKRETDTMPNWAGSNWYFLRYCDPKDDKSLADFKKLKYWLPVDLYNGGMEHVNLHLLYSRFIYKFLYDIGVVPTSEPYAKRRSHGVVLGPDGQKMSKSQGNVINPDEVIKAWGADSFRLYESFMGPFEQMISWSDEGLEGCFRFLKRVWQLNSGKVRDLSTPKHLQVSLHRTIKKVSEDLENLKFNTAVAAMMEFINEWSKAGGFLNKKEAKIFLQILAPFAPHITEELWSRLEGKFSIHSSPWPKYKRELIEEAVVTVVVQVNGKMRDKIELESERVHPEGSPRGAREQEEIEKLARESEKIKKYLAGKKIKKIIFVPGRLINFVTDS